MMVNPQPKRRQVKLTAHGWRNLRDAVLEIDGHVCRACNKQRATDAHHVHRRGRLRLDVIGNLVAVCRGCHGPLSDGRVTLEWAEPVAYQDGVTLGGETPETRRVVVRRVCPECAEIGGGMGPSHDGSKLCESGSIASGGTRAHCTCDVCF